MTAKPDTDFRAGHRDRMRQKFLDGKLADYELLELFLGYAIPRRDVRPLARGLIAHFGSVSQVLAAPIDDLENYNGVGHNTAVLIKALYELTLLSCRVTLKESVSYHKDEDIREYCRRLALGKSVEEFHVLYFDRDRHLVEDELHTRGTIDCATIYIREIVAKALKHKAAEIVLMHNHPISQRSFSQDDIKSTKELETILLSLGISLYDHMVVSGTILYSMRELRMLEERRHVTNNA